MKKPLVSIGMPLHNGGRYLDGRIKNVLDQTYKNFELIISNNRSTDDSLRICEHWAGLDARIVLHNQVDFLTATRNFEFVFANAKGDFFCWVAHDDLWSRDWIEVCLQSLIENQRANFAATKVYEVIGATFREKVFYDLKHTNLSHDDIANKFDLPKIFIDRWAINSIVSDENQFEQLGRTDEVLLYKSYPTYFYNHGYNVKAILLKSLNVMHMYALHRKESFREVRFPWFDYSWDHALVFQLLMNGSGIYVNNGYFLKRGHGKLWDGQLSMISFAYRRFILTFFVLFCYYRLSNLSASHKRNFRDTLFIFVHYLSGVIGRCYIKLIPKAIRTIFSSR